MLSAAVMPCHRVATPLGELLATANARGEIERLAFDAQPVAEATPHPALEAAMARYFAGEPEDFGSIALAPRGTEFQRRVWTALRTIPFGATRSYGELARLVGSNPRTVGQANGQNPVAIVIPCHRVIGADGSLVGYAGGIERKRRLLVLEGSRLL